MNELDVEHSRFPSVDTSPFDETYHRHPIEPNPVSSRRHEAKKDLPNRTS
jgi:hypothetical protein